MKEVFDSLGFNEFIPLINKEITLTKEFSEDGLMLSGGQIQKSHWLARYIETIPFSF